MKGVSYRPRYISLHRSGELKDRGLMIRHLFPEIDNSVKREAYQGVVREARKCGLVNLDVDA